MQSINLKEFNSYILESRFIYGNEISWFKDDLNPINKIGVIIDRNTGYQAITYKRREDNFFWLDKFKKFDDEQSAYDFLITAMVLF